MAAPNSSPRRTSGAGASTPGVRGASELPGPTPSRFFPGSKTSKSRLEGEHLSSRMGWVLSQKVLCIALALTVTSYLGLYLLAGRTGLALNTNCKYPDVQELRQSHRQHASLYACLQETWSIEGMNATVKALVSSTAGLDSICLDVITGQQEASLPKHRLIRFLRDAKGLAGTGGFTRRPLYIRTDVPGLVCRIASVEFGSVEMCFKSGEPLHEQAYREVPCHVHVSIPRMMFEEENSLHSGLSSANGSQELVNSGALEKGLTKDGLRPDHLRPIAHVCVSITIGDDTDMPSEQALPYGKILRLFRRAREIVAANPSSAERRIHIGADYPTIPCNIARDEMEKPEFTCETYHSGGKHKDPILCDILVVGASSKYVRQDPAFIQGKHRWPWLGRPLEWVDLDKDEIVVPVVPNPRRTLLTSVSDDHFEAVFRFVRSVDFFCPPGICNWDLVVYDMYLRPEYREKLDCLVGQMKRIKVEMRTWDFSKYPAWMDLRNALGEYAWKALMVKEILDVTGNALWMDGGNRITSVEGLLTVFDKYENKLGGFYCPGHSGGVVKEWTHPDEIKYLRMGDHLDDLNCNAAVIGFTLQSYKTIFWDWYECSIIRQCIAPEGSSRQNHRQDQAALTLIAAKWGNPCVDATEVPIHWDSTEYNENVTATTC
eukprot:TRINITY_DN18921_c0_g1_i1.p1 TRINITY_DN18921_c0_g1~~TRINITY_DN18921_c0_g1_i1.p1  ORF type:complete len:659 (-),score=139.63 TRINITY_DN18921_c0_g1_i1:407-2383(-)